MSTVDHLSNTSGQVMEINCSNFSEKEFLIDLIGPQTTRYAMTYCIIYGIIFCTGMIGNTLTIVVMIKGDLLSNSASWYMLSLAVSDVLRLVIGLLIEIHEINHSYPWVFGSFICILRNTVTEMTSYVSILTITALTVERFIAVCHPLRSRKVQTPERARRILVIVWGVAALSASPLMYFSAVYYYSTNPCNNDEIIEDSLVCYMPNDRVRTVYTSLSTLVFFIPPMTIITVLYIMMAVRLRRGATVKVRSDASGKASADTLLSVTRSQSTATPGPSRNRRAFGKSRHDNIQVVLVFVVVAFFICWAPFHTQRILSMLVSYESSTPALRFIVNILYIISGVCLFTNSTVNPLLYNLVSMRFRATFCAVLCCRHGRSGSGTNGTSRFANSPNKFKPPDSQQSRVLASSGRTSQSPSALQTRRYHSSAVPMYQMRSPTTLNVPQESIGTPELPSSETRNNMTGTPSTSVEAAPLPKRYFPRADNRRSQSERRLSSDFESVRRQIAERERARRRTIVQQRKLVKLYH